MALLGLLIVPALPAQRIRLDRLRRAIDRHYDVEIGFIGGPNRNTATGAGPVDPKFRGSFGGFLSVPVVGDFRIRPEIAVSGKQVGWRNEFIQPCLPDLPDAPCGPVSQLETGSFTWLEVPILLEARFHRALRELGTPRLYAGPFVAVRLACSFAVPVPSDEPAPAGSDGPRLVTPCASGTAGSTRYNNGDAGFVVGGAIGLGPVGLGLRWIRSLVPIAPDQSTVDGRPFVGAKHSTLALTLEFGTRIR
jgi:hypothetical protein